MLRLRLAADATEMLLRQISLPSAEIPALVALFSSLAGDHETAAKPKLAFVSPQPAAAVSRVTSSPPTIAARKTATAASRKTAAAVKPTKGWKQVRPTNPPLTALEKVRIRVRRSSIRLDDRTAMAIVRASGKAVGRDMLEGIEGTTDGRIMLCFGFIHGSAKFFVAFDPAEENGALAMAALVNLASAPI